LETSLLFASEGANVLLVDVNVKAAKSVVALIETRYPNVKAVAVKTDVGVEKEVKEAVDLAVKEFGRLDIMVRDSPVSIGDSTFFWRRPHRKALHATYMGTGRNGDTTC
jgi:NAD(P)-dependent dehydrogenase (short-subunit alcohol dehydrogenase family)